MNLRSLCCATGSLVLIPCFMAAAEGVSSSNSSAPKVDVAQATQDWTRIYVGARPSVSADGKQFVFEWNDRIWIAPTTGGTARVLAAGDNSRDSWPVLSPDGKRVAFLSNRMDLENLFELNLENGSLRRVTINSNPPRPYAYASDGKTFVTTVTRDHADDDHASRLALVSPTGVETVLFDAMASEPALSPDGTKVLFTRGGDNIYRKRAKTFSSYAAEIWLYDIKTKTFTLVIQKKTDSRTPLWAPDGLGFYYVSGDGGSKNLRYHALNPDAEAQKALSYKADFALTFFKGDNIVQPTISADGHTIVFRQGFDFWRLDLTEAHPKPQLIVLHPDASWTPPLATTRNRWYTSIGNPDGNGGFSFCLPEGEEVAFSCGGDLWVMNMSEKEPVCLHGDTLTLERDCAFSPDGNDLYFLTDHGDGTDLWVARREDPKKPWTKNKSFKKTRLLADGVTRQNISLSPDGKRLMWRDGFSRLHFANTNGLDVVDGPNMPADDVFAWSPDGKWLACGFADNHKNYDIWIVSTTGARPPCNVSRHFKWDGEPAWSADGKILAWAGSRDEGTRIFYFYLDGKGGKGAPNEIDFEDIELRIKTINTSRASSLFFHSSEQKLAFNDGSQTSYVVFPNELSPKRLTAKRGVAQLWGTKKDKGRLLWSVGNKPALYEYVADFNVYPIFNLPDYRELLGRTVWGRIRDRFYDGNFHGADWGAIKAKYVPAFRNATSWTVIQRIVYMMLGELDASHLGFYHSDISRTEWQPGPFGQNWRAITLHLGLRFDPTYEGPGLRVRDVLHDGPADKANCGIKPGDIVTEINNKKTDPKQDLATYLTTHDQLKVSFTFGHPGEPATNVVRVKAINYSDARTLVGEQWIRANRQLVHKLSNGRVGYVYVAAMDHKEFKRFESEVFSEGYGRDALIIDVRNNHGGYTADQMLSILCAQEHSFEVPRNGQRGYLMGYTVHPVWTKPIGVICNAITGSNGEIFTHAVKTLKRGIVVGQPTGGAVIATNDRPLLDYGKFRDAEFGWFVKDGTDMESNGAVPHILVPLTPIDEVRGVDPQLERTVKELLKK